MTRPVPVRHESRLVFTHPPCGAQITNATTEPVKYGAWCPRCTPDTLADDFAWPASTGWVQVFHPASPSELGRS